jgi:hypothetical protein
VSLHDKWHHLDVPDAVAVVVVADAAAVVDSSACQGHPELSLKPRAGRLQMRLSLLLAFCYATLFFR